MAMVDALMRRDGPAAANAVMMHLAEVGSVVSPADSAPEARREADRWLTAGAGGPTRLKTT
jgi:DNA-binding GntR family transcriptional regulator